MSDNIHFFIFLFYFGHPLLGLLLELYEIEMHFLDVCLELCEYGCPCRTVELLGLQLSCGCIIEFLRYNLSVRYAHLCMHFLLLIGSRLGGL